ncbi:unnamed protein product [Litomosoides sigmodontis]|uniref:Domain of unknown function DB domain-containing protein n=1 Tax=Litomosoides sigmodontis TaxID=42156 RepID=A0A3P6VCU8_LITSI|nr:unnamed protein product [Litomosoides sigmodontis]VDM91625.1 unnamed protein product [Litomosoides sigmodontis]
MLLIAQPDLDTTLTKKQIPRPFSAAGNDGSRHGFGKTNGIGMPWKRVVQLPKISVGQRPTKFRTSGNSNEIALAASVNSLNSTGLLPYQQRRNTYQYREQYHTAAPFFPSRAQHYSAAQSSPLYYNPWDPLGLLNNPFWKSIFPNLFAPQPQLLVSTTLKPTQTNLDEMLKGVGLQEGLALPKQSSLSPNEKLSLCCTKQNLSPHCQILCNYDAFTERTLVTAVVTNQCPGYELEMAFNCATSRADHSACCIRSGISEYRNGHCMVFCTTHLGNPRNTLQYIDCLQVFDRIKNCYREYHIVNPNIYGDL